MKLNETTGLYENYGAWHIPFWQTDSFLLVVKIGICVAFCIISIVSIRMFIRYKKRKIVSGPEQLLADLYALKRDHKLQAALGKEFYIHVSEIVKRYFFYCFDYDVLGKTDAELLDFLHTKFVDEKTIEEIKHIVSGGEIVKFANAQAIQDRIVADYEKVVFLVQQTVSHKNNIRP